MKAIKKLIDELNQARKALKMKILAEMESEAIKQDFDLFRLTCRGNTFKRSGREVGCAEIRKLFQTYTAHVSLTGIALYWEKGQGYV
jgi:hypothetical protein